jgi:predicted nuclease with TOPRIM domain
MKKQHLTDICKELTAAGYRVMTQAEYDRLMGQVNTAQAEIDRREERIKEIQAEGCATEIQYMLEAEELDRRIHELAAQVQSLTESNSIWMRRARNHEATLSQMGVL